MVFNIFTRVGPHFLTVENIFNLSKI